MNQRLSTSDPNAPAATPSLASRRRAQAHPARRVIVIAAAVLTVAPLATAAAATKKTAKKAPAKSAKAVARPTTTKAPAKGTNTTVARTVPAVGPVGPEPTAAPSATVAPTAAPATAATTTAAPTSLATSTTATPDFAIRVAQPSQTVARTETAAYNLFVDAGPGYPGSVTLAITDLPPGTEATYDPIPINTVGQVRIRTSANTPAGNFQIRVLASTARTTVIVPLVLSVTEAAPTTTTTTLAGTTTTSTTIGTKTFTVQAVVNGGQVSAGTSVRVDVTVIPSGGFNEPVSLGVSGSYDGVSAAFVKSPISIAETGQLWISAASNATLKAGTATFTITASGGGVIRTTQVSLLVK